MKTLVIFDIDGTLTNTNQVEGQCYVEAFNHTFGFEDRSQNWEDLNNVTDWGIAEEILFQKTGRHYTFDQIKPMIPRFVEGLREAFDRDPTQFSEVPGAIKFYHECLHIDQFVVGIATGSWEESGKIKLNSIGIDPYKVYYAHSNLYKSREQITNHVIQAAEKDHPGQLTKVVYFGDGIWDFRTCRNLNIDFIGIDVQENGKLQSIGAQIVYPNFLNQTALLEQILTD